MSASLRSWAGWGPLYALVERSEAVNLKYVLLPIGRDTRVKDPWCNVQLVG